MERVQHDPHRRSRMSARSLPYWSLLVPLTGFPRIVSQFRTQPPRRTQDQGVQGCGNAEWASRQGARQVGGIRKSGVPPQLRSLSHRFSCDADLHLVTSHSSFLCSSFDLLVWTRSRWSIMERCVRLSLQPLWTTTLADHLTFASSLRTGRRGGSAPNPTPVLLSHCTTLRNSSLSSHGHLTMRPLLFLSRPLSTTPTTPFATARHSMVTHRHEAFSLVHGPRSCDL